MESTGTKSPFWDRPRRRNPRIWSRRGTVAWRVVPRTIRTSRCSIPIINNNLPGIHRSRVRRRWSADVSVDGEQAEVTSTFAAPCDSPPPWTRGIVGDPGTRMLGRLAITITIEGEGSSDTRRAATTRRSERPNRASRSSTLACPYWAWASPARRTRTTASTIICRTCLPRTSSRSSSYDPTARPPSCPRLSLSIRVSNVPRKNKEEKTIWLFTRRVTRRKRAAIPIDMFRIRRRKKSIESFQTIVSTSISIEIHEIYIFSLDRSPIRWFAGDRSIFVSKISRNRRFVWHYSTVFFFVFPRGLALSLSETISTAPPCRQAIFPVSRRR